MIRLHTLCTRKNLLSALTMLLLFIISISADAGIVASSTRIIFLQGDRENTLMLANTNEYPVVVQSWIDDGDVDNTPDQAKAPFLPLPAVFKMQPGSIQSLRIISKGNQPTSDRESVYWLNLYEIPPKDRSNNHDNPQVAMAMNTQMKVFYRPKELTLSPEAAMKKVNFTLIQNAGKTLLRSHNPTPYHVSFGQMTLNLQGKKVNILQEMDMMTPPFSEREYSTENPLPANSHGATLTYSYFDDSGAQISQTQSL
ncbi:molecular chaperone [Yersinia nurmii]|uniref:Molecular chaperone n=1 Tax=Yersinia nurmii TaxID=685706 RepID=A0AAW7JX15_9GAMM|nr:molecular chaperone [Yersinia nurmii]MDN0086991.1 molecular chaperone [Yersinia nurmii]CNE16987.1 pili assembly chaperone [Yersinia nurmii]